MTNKIIILKDNGGRLANQLWLYSYVYSYCLEKKYQFENYAFFRYQHYFGLQTSDKLINLLARLHLWHKKIKVSKLLYNFYAAIIQILFSRQLIKDGGREFFLPPTPTSVVAQQQSLAIIDSAKNKTFFFCGWLFNNEVGQKKYYNEIKDKLRPAEVYYSKILNLKTELLKKYKLLVGVHIRQGDYKTWQGGKFFYSEAEVAGLLKDFLKELKGFEPKEVVFVVCTDGLIDEVAFMGLNIVKGPGSEITDLYMLAETDLIIGSTSTYGAWAAYYGQIPFVQFSRQSIDWSKIALANNH
ncbi:MAG: alpha-1,2-fucosyltransferase [Candidatus Komeilibacteria bacterium]|nr:alpha-1,2-fucosyltransferase [Candidatus Komeilibacteria bacterium]